MGDDTTYVKSSLRQDGDTQNSGTLPGSTGMFHNPEDAYRKHDYEDTNTNDKDNRPILREMERTKVDTGHSPKRNKKMKIDKNGKQQSERSGSLPRRVTIKAGNPKVLF